MRHSANYFLAAFALACGVRGAGQRRAGGVNYDRIAIYDPRGDSDYPFVVKEWSRDLWGCWWWATIARFATVAEARMLLQ